MSRQLGGENVLKRKSNDENAGPSTSPGGRGSGKALRSKEGRRVSSSRCSVKWDILPEDAERLYKELGVGILPAVASPKDEEPSTPKNGRRGGKENSAESGYNSRTSITPVFSRSCTGLTPPFGALDINVLSNRSGLKMNASFSSDEESSELDKSMKRKKKMLSINDLGEEMILYIFTMLPRKVLALRCMLVNKKWNGIAHSRSLWKCGVDLKSQTLSAAGVRGALELGVFAVRLAITTITEDVQFKSPTFLEYLDMSVANISVGNLNTILANNEVSLKKLSLENLQINQKTLDLLTGKHTKLEHLNLALCELQKPDAMFKEALSPNLKELNLSWVIKLEAEKVVNFLPHDLKKLNISGYKGEFDDTTVAKVASRCPDLIELDLSDCANLTSDTLFTIAEELKDIRTLSVSRCYLMDDFSDILNISRLESLNVFGIELDVNVPSLAINESSLSTVARPTVGIRRSTIWGVKLS